METQTTHTSDFHQSKHGSQKSNGSILLIEDDLDQSLFYSENLSRLNYKVAVATNESSALSMLKDSKFDLILLDYFLKDTIAPDLLPKLTAITKQIPVIILTSHGSVHAAVNCVQNGASGFLLKTDSLNLNLQRIQDYMQMSRGTHDVIDYSRHGIVGVCEAMQAVFKIIAKVSSTDAPVLITGESGTGKEVAARTIHNISSRGTSGPFVAVNCAAISEHLLEAELFGCVKGAFTGADRSRVGYFESANSGTIFLDEIGEMSPALQAKLLRVLQEKEVTPVGSVRPIRINARVVAATNCELVQAMDSGKFREDLYYRLAVVELRLPPLRNRRDDIPLLLRYFWDRANQKYNKRVRLPAPSVVATLTEQNWNGNVREFANLVERAILLSDGDNTNISDYLIISDHHEHDEQDAQTKSVNNHLDESTSPTSSSSILKLEDARNVFEEQYLKKLIQLASGNVQNAAQLCDQPVNVVYRLLRKHKIKCSKFRKLH
jgi:two-component system response regulator HydG